MSFINEFQTIVSKQNQQYKNICKMIRSKNSPVVALEGFRMCETALAAGMEPQTIVVSQELLSAAQEERLAGWTQFLGSEFQVISQRLNVSAAMLKQMSNTVRPQGVLLLVERPTEKLVPSPDFRRGLLVAEHIQDPGNIGTLIRIADAFGLDGFVYTADSADPWQDKALRSTMGSIFHLPIYRIDCIEDLISYLHQNQIPLIATALSGGDIRQAQVQLPVALVMGNEGNGVSEETLEACAQTVKIEMAGQAESLNVAVAAGICCYEIFK